MSDRTITITMSIEYAQTAIDSLENDIELTDSGYPNFRDVSEMTYYLRRAELLEMLWAAVREASVAEEPTEETEGAELLEMLLAAVREASVAEEPTEETEGEDVYWSYSKPKSETA
jgi:hypothetical protein